MKNIEGTQFAFTFKTAHGQSRANSASIILSVSSRFVNVCILFIFFPWDA